jgi:hypothetical protein
VQRTEQKLRVHHRSIKKPRRDGSSRSFALSSIWQTVFAPPHHLINPRLINVQHRTEGRVLSRKETTLNMHLGDTRLLIEAGRERGLLRNQMAYVLATAYTRPRTR